MGAEPLEEGSFGEELRAWNLGGRNEWEAAGLQGSGPGDVTEVGASAGMGRAGGRRTCLALPIAPHLHFHQCHANVTLSPSGQCLRGTPVVEHHGLSWVGGPRGPAY